MGQRLTDTEALLWSIGRDPNLASTMGLVALLDGRPDPERFLATMTATVGVVDRLRQKIDDPAGLRPTMFDAAQLSRPEWVVDHQFDLAYHVRFARLSGSGSRPAGEAELRRAAALFINDPFDRARPLWQFQLVTGLRGGRSAVLGKVHHSISDGIGLLKLAATMLEFEADAEPPEPVDLTTLIATETETDGDDEPHERSGPDGVRGWLTQAARALGSAKTFTNQLPKAKPSGLWASRSRNRRLEFLTVPLPSLKRRSVELEATINDVFIAACAEAAVRYHDHHDQRLPSISATVVVNTAAPPAADDDQLGEGDNAFIPVAVTVPGDGASAMDRLRLMQEEVRKRRAAIGERSDLVSTISALGGLMPSSMAASLALDQAAKVDFATSNIPGPPVPTWMAGRPVSKIYPVGPVAGTAFNVTLMTYDQVVHLGIHHDPAAVADGELLRRCLSDGFADFGVARR